MAKGKFSKPRTPARQDREMDRTFREVTGQSGDDVATETTSPAVARNKKIILISLCSVAVVLLIGAIVAVSFLTGVLGDDGLILNNVTVAGVNLGGMTRAEAEDAIRSATQNTYTQQDMVIVLPETTLTLSPANTGAQLDVEAAVKAAYQYGRTGSAAEREAARNQILSGAHHIALLPFLNLNTDYIRGIVEDYCTEFSTTYEAPSYKLEGQMPTLEGDKFDENAPCQTLLLNPGIPGKNLDADNLYNKILDAYSFNRLHLELNEAGLNDSHD